MNTDTPDEEKLTASILIRMTPEMKAQLEDKVYWDRVKIPELFRDWIEQYNSEPSENQPT